MIESDGTASELKRKDEVRRISKLLCLGLELNQVHRMISMNLEE